jgi:hypothetical protein
MPPHLPSHLAPPSAHPIHSHIQLPHLSQPSTTTSINRTANPLHDPTSPPQPPISGFHHQLASPQSTPSTTSELQRNNHNVNNSVPTFALEALNPSIHSLNDHHFRTQGQQQQLMMSPTFSLRSNHDLLALPSPVTGVSSITGPNSPPFQLDGLTNPNHHHGSAILRSAHHSSHVGTGNGVNDQSPVDQHGGSSAGDDIWPPYFP